jgi:hypothetical protein
MSANLRKKQTGDVFSNKYYPQLTRFQGEKMPYNCEGFTSSEALTVNQNCKAMREFYGWI